MVKQLTPIQPGVELEPPYLVISKFETLGVFRPFIQRSLNYRTNIKPLKPDYQKVRSELNLTEQTTPVQIRNLNSKSSRLSKNCSFFSVSDKTALSEV